MYHTCYKLINYKYEETRESHDCKLMYLNIEIINFLKKAAELNWFASTFIVAACF